MGRYNNGTKEYDQSFYNTLWSIPPFVQRDLATERLRVDDPRANIVLGAHIWDIIKALNGK